MPTLVWDVRSALVDLFTETLDVKVFDGPQSRAAVPKSYVLVGTDGGDTGQGEDGGDFATTSQELSPMGPGTWRDETGEIVCSLWVWGGSTTFAPLRASATAVLDSIELALRSDRTLGDLLAPGGGYAELGSVRIREDQTENGARLRAVFTVSFRALLTT